MNLKIKLQPSPRARHARKPMFSFPYAENKENIQTNSLDRLKNSKKIQDTLFHSVQKQKIQKLKQSDKQNRPHNEQLNNKVDVVNGQKKCKNHLTRKAVHFLQRNNKQYFCFQCSLHEARKGSRLQALKNDNLQKLKINQRQNQIQSYLKKSQQMQRCYKNSIGYCSEILQEYKREWQRTIVIQQKKFENFFNKALQKHKLLIGQIDKFYKTQIQQIEKYWKVIQEKYRLILYNKIDIHKNYQECLSQFEDQQYRYVMDKYWQKMKIATQSLVRTQELKKAIDMGSLTSKLDNIINSLQSPSNNRKEKQFTFSKSNRYQTPESNKKSQIQDVQIIESTNHGSAMKMNMNMMKKKNKNQSGFMINSFQYMST